VLVAVAALLVRVVAVLVAVLVALVALVAVLVALVAIGALLVCVALPRLALLVLSRGAQALLAVFQLLVGLALQAFVTLGLRLGFHAVRRWRLRHSRRGDRDRRACAAHSGPRDQESVSARQAVSSRFVRRWWCGHRRTHWGSREGFAATPARE